jgi:glycosyltransferase involved in cell wall biosynthesis
LNNAVNVEEFLFNKEMRQKIRRELNVHDELVIGHIGRFNKQKNHEFLIDIFKLVVEKRPDAVLVMAGEGNLKPQIEKKVADLGLSSNVRFLGVRSDIANLMQGLDLFLFPSLFEGLPVVLVEAQAAGLKCLISDSITKETNITERIEFASLGESPEEWANKILSSTYEHVDTSKQLSEKGYDTKTMAKWLADYYLDYYVKQA